MVTLLYQGQGEWIYAPGIDAFLTLLGDTFEHNEFSKEDYEIYGGIRYDCNALNDVFTALTPEAELWLMMNAPAGYQLLDYNPFLKEPNDDPT